MGLMINGENIKQTEIQRETEQLRAAFEQMGEKERSKYGLKSENIEETALEWSRENVIERVLLRQEAERDVKVKDRAEIEKALAELKEKHTSDGKSEDSFDEKMVREEIETRIKLDRLIAKVTAQVSNPKNKEIADYYRKNRSHFRVPEKIHAAHIVKNIGDGVTEKEASQAINSIWEKLQKGETFEVLADRYSDCPGNGGDLGHFPRGKMVEEFDQIVFSLEVGAVSAIFQTCFGFHIAKVYKRSPECMKNLAEVREEVSKQLKVSRERKAVERFIDKLRAKADIRQEHL